MVESKIAVIGAGPMGLVCTLELLKKGYQVDLYEHDDRVGGMSATFNFDGLEIERYYHFICKTDYPYFELLEELGMIDKLKWTQTKMGFFYNGKLYKWGNPLALLYFKGLDPITKIRYALHVFYTKSIDNWDKLDKVNAVQWLQKWLGMRGYDVLWKSLFELKFYEYTNSLSAAWIGTRIKRVALSRKNLFTELLGYLEGGSEILLREMEKRILEHGGKIYLKSGVEKIVIDGSGHIKGIMINGKEHEYDKVISTIPLPYIHRIAADFPKDFLDKISAIRNIAVACVILKLKRSLTENFWLNINDPDIEIPGIIEYSNLNRVGPAIVYAPFYMPQTHPKYQRSNQDLINEVIGYLGSINPEFNQEWVIASRLSRYTFAQTICPPGFFDMLPPMKTPIVGFFMADTSYYYPEDRSISESVRVGKMLAMLASN